LAASAAASDTAYQARKDAENAEDYENPHLYLKAEVFLFQHFLGEDFYLFCDGFFSNIFRLRRKYITSLVLVDFLRVITKFESDDSFNRVKVFNIVVPHVSTALTSLLLEVSGAFVLTTTITPLIFPVIELSVVADNQLLLAVIWHNFSCWFSSSDVGQQFFLQGFNCPDEPSIAESWWIGEWHYDSNRIDGKFVHLV